MHRVRAQDWRAHSGFALLASVDRSCSALEPYMPIDRRVGKHHRALYSSSLPPQTDLVRQAEKRVSTAHLREQDLYLISALAVL